MVSHANLVAEIDVVNSMSTEDRLTHARQRRQEQIQRWHDAEIEHEDEGKKGRMMNGGMRERKKAVKFGASVTLLEAAARDDIDEVKSLLQNETDPNEANDDGLTALHQACIDNFEGMVRLLIKYGANVNAVDSEQWTPLHAACTCGHTNISMILIQSGADLLALNADHNMPYDICEDDETLDFVEKAMASRGITQEQINETRSSKEKQIIADMQHLLKEGKHIDYKDEVGATVLHIAAANGYAILAKFLIDNHSKVNMQDNDGWTPLHAAACWNQLDIVELLGQQGGDPTIKNSLGEIPADVTEDEEIRILLVKIKSLMKDRKKKLFPGFRISSRNNSRRASGIRGQSFKGRSKRDKKSGISTIEAKSEAQFWSGHQEEIIKSKPPTDNNNHIENSTSRSEAAEADLKVIPKENGHKKAKNSSENEPISPEIEIDNPSKVIPTSNVSKSDKKERKQKKSKKGQQGSGKPPSQVQENHPDKTDMNGSRSGKICNVGANRNSYNLDADDWSVAYAKGGTNPTAGKTLAEVKRERAQEKSNKSLAPDGDHSPVIASFSDGLKQYKGLTASELSEKSSSKRKFCVIL